MKKPTRSGVKVHAIVLQRSTYDENIQIEGKGGRLTPLVMSTSTVIRDAINSAYWDASEELQDRAIVIREEYERALAVIETSLMAAAAKIDLDVKDSRTTVEDLEKLWAVWPESTIVLTRGDFDELVKAVLALPYQGELRSLARPFILAIRRTPAVAAESLVKAEERVENGAPATSEEHDTP